MVLLVFLTLFAKASEVILCLAVTARFSLGWAGSITMKVVESAVVASGWFPCGCICSILLLTCYSSATRFVLFVLDFHGFYFFCWF